MYELISEKLNSVLCQQMAHERYNAGLYMKIAGALEDKGLSNLAKIFINQTHEEYEHAEQIYKYIIDVNGKISMEVVNKVSDEFNTISDIAKAYIDAEHVIDKAGAYAIQGKGAAMIDKIDGCYYNVMGLPLSRLVSMLEKIGFEFLTK